MFVTTDTPEKQHEARALASEETGFLPATFFMRSRWAQGEWTFLSTCRCAAKGTRASSSLSLPIVRADKNIRAPLLQLRLCRMRHGALHAQAPGLKIHKMPVATRGKAVQVSPR
jgi:hypothetical protein